MADIDVTQAPSDDKAEGDNGNEQVNSAGNTSSTGVSSDIEQSAGAEAPASPATSAPEGFGYRLSAVKNKLPGNTPGADNKRNIIDGLLVVLVIILAVLSVVLGSENNSLKSKNNSLSNQIAQLNANPQAIIQRQTQDLINKVGKLMTLPTGETPTIANVTNAAEAKQQSAFFNNAQNGDKVLMYVKAGEAILYRPSTNKIILVAPLTLNSSTTGTAPAGTTKR